MLVENNVLQGIKPVTIPEINIIDLLEYINFTEKMLDKINIISSIYFYNNEKIEIGVISHSDTTGKIMLRMISYLYTDNNFITDRDNFLLEIKKSDMTINIENFVNYISLLETFVKYDININQERNNENKINQRINISDIDLWTTKRLSSMF